jgi:hypothetical protein
MWGERAFCVESMEIGKPTREYVVEPLEDPVPREAPAPEPERETPTPEPVETPSRESRT